MIFNADCLDKLKEFEDQSFDFCITDPPYGITKSSWDVVPNEEIFKEIFRVSKNQIIFGGHFFNLPKKDGWIIWNKMPFLKTTNECELLWTSFLKKNKKIDFIYAGNCIGTRKPDYSKKKVFFTSEKPYQFIELVLQSFTKEGDLILDPFMGTGSTGYACNNTKRIFTGIEKSTEQFKVAQEKLGIL